MNRVMGFRKDWTVELHSLMKQEANGLRGDVVSFDEARGRVGVRIKALSQVLQVKPENLRHVPTEGVHDDIELADSIGEWLKDAEVDALDGALMSEDWALAVRVLGNLFAVACPNTSMDELRKVVADNPQYAAWADPRIDVEWEAKPPLDQWNSLSTFLAKTVDRIGYTVVEAIEDPRLDLGIAMSMTREGHPPRGRLSKDVLYDAFMFHLVQLYLRTCGILELMSTSDGKGWCVLAEILEGGVGAVFYALSQKSFLSSVTMSAIVRMNAGA